MSFPHGSLAEIARQAGISKGFLSNALLGRRNISPDLAERLVRAARYQGLETSPFDWMNPDMTTNTLFKEYQER